MLGHSIVSQHFIEPEGSIPNSQELSTIQAIGTVNNATTKE
jgi:hypothetical protein